MKTSNLALHHPGQTYRHVSPAPSLRVPVTRKNRALLRWLRSAELRAWQEADSHPRRPSQVLRADFETETFFNPQMKSL